MGFFDKIKAGLRKTRESISGSIESMLSGFTKIDEELFEELEELLVMGDVGIYTAERICEQLRDKVKKSGITDPNEVMGLLKEIVAEMLSGGEALQIENKPAAILVIGVNGVGKTTTIGKLASRLKQEGNSVVLGAADTFRAAAIDQLEIWSERAGVPMVKRDEGSDPASVVFDTIAKAKSLKADVLICDTAGRLHNKKNLMDELGKISRILNRELPDSDKEVLLVLDATTGQNAVNQAREFKSAAGITGIILTKLDGTAKGGVVLAIREELQLPVKFIGVGEQIDDLQPFDAVAFADALFDNTNQLDEDTVLRIAEQNARYDAYGELVIDDEQAEREWAEWETGTEAGDAAEEAKDLMADIHDALKEVLEEEGLEMPKELEPETEPEAEAAERIEEIEEIEEVQEIEEIAEIQEIAEIEETPIVEEPVCEPVFQKIEEIEEAPTEPVTEAFAEAFDETPAEQPLAEMAEPEIEEILPEEEPEVEQRKESWFERRAREKAERRALKEAQRQEREAAQEQEAIEETVEETIEEAPAQALYEEPETEAEGLTQAELEALEQYEAEQEELPHKETWEERRARKEREKEEKRARKEAEKAERKKRRWGE